MLRAVALVFFAVELGAGFGAASAEFISTSSNAIEVELRVEIQDSADAVLAHLVFEDRAPVTLPLIQRETGVFGIRTEIEPLNYQVVFEIIGPEPAQSDPLSLMQLGLVIPSEGPSLSSTSTSDQGGISEETANTGWLALALAAAALSALAFWALGGDDPDQDDSDEPVVEGADGAD